MRGLAPTRRAALLLIRAYQLSASALVGRQCRYLPTCSDYAAEAVTLHGVWPGLWMAGARLCRCHPFGAWGYDPVPRRCEAVPATRPWRYGVWRMRVVTPLSADDLAERSCDDRRPDRGGDPQDRASSSAARP